MILKVSESSKCARGNIGRTLQRTAFTLTIKISYSHF